MQIERLREFMALARCSCFTTAADKLHITQPALSNHIADMEKELGTKLLSSRKGDIGLTAAGRVMFRHAANITAEYDSALREIADSAVSSPDSYKITMKSYPVSTIAGEVFARIIGTAESEDKRVNVNLAEMRNKSLFDESKKGAVDCACIIGSEHCDQIIPADVPVRLFFLHRSPLYVWAPAGHPLFSLDSICLKDIAQYPYPFPSNLVFEEWEAAILSIFAEQELIPKLIQRFCESFDEYASSINGDEALLFTSKGMDSNPKLQKALVTDAWMCSYIALRTTRNDYAMQVMERAVQNVAQTLSA